MTLEEFKKFKWITGYTDWFTLFFKMERIIFYLDFHPDGHAYPYIYDSELKSDMLRQIVLDFEGDIKFPEHFMEFVKDLKQLAFENEAALEEYYDFCPSFQEYKFIEENTWLINDLD